MAAQDVVFIAAIVFTLGLGLFIAHYVVTQSVNDLIANPQFSTSEKAVNVMTSAQDTAQRYDYIVFAGFVALFFGLLVTGWLVGGHPLFMVAYFIVVCIVIGISAVFSNVWGDVSSMSFFGSTVSSFPITNHILGSFPYYMAVVGITGMLVMFAKPFIIERSEV